MNFFGITGHRKIRLNTWTNIQLALNQNLQ